jgi:hypothetical protein
MEPFFVANYFLSLSYVHRDYQVSHWRFFAFGHNGNYCMDGDTPR